MTYSTLSQMQNMGASRMPGSQMMRYPSPYLDIGNTYYPQTIRELLQLCRMFYWTHPLISATINKLARYPVTDLTFAHSKSNAVADFWLNLMCDIVRIRSFLIRVHLDTLALGNAFVSIIYPFKRRLVCGKCKQSTDAKLNYDHWEYMGGKFVLDCPHCGHRGPSTVDDVYIRSPRDVRLHLWDPMDVIIEDTDYPGTTRYMYRIPRNLGNSIRLGKKAVVCQVPMFFIEAVERSKMVVFSADNLFHIKRQVVSGKHKGWGMPLIANVLKLAFQLQIMMKTNEQIMTEHMIPLRFLFPQAPGVTADPFSNVWMTNWKAKVEEEVRHWRQDPNYLPITPLPVGAQSIGGEGRALMLNAEMRMQLEMIVASMEVPQSFVFSGGNYTGSIVDMRQLENLCLGMVEDDRELVRWVIEHLAAYLKMPKPESWHFKPFKQADDLTRRQLYIALWDRGLADGHAVCAMNDLEFDAVTDMRKKEAKIDAEIKGEQAKAAATAQGEAQITAARFQVRAQAAAAQQMKALQQGPMSGSTPPGGIGGPQETEQPTPSTDDLLPTSGIESNTRFFESGDGLAVTSDGTRVQPEALARGFASQLAGMDTAQRDLYLSQLQAEMPQVHGLVMQHLSGPAPGTITQPLPEQRPPRAELSTI
jgi:hypothetical protein